MMPVIAGPRTAGDTRQDKDLDVPTDCASKTSVAVSDLFTLPYFVLHVCGLEGGDGRMA